MWEAFFAVLKENIVSFFFGTVLLGTAFDFLRRAIEYCLTWKYRNWHLEVVPKDPNRKKYTHKLLWDEVRRFEESPFENKKFIQSVCTSEDFRLRPGQIPTDNPDSWVFRDDRNRLFKYDFRKIPQEILQEKSSKKS
jgi:hypothetical protein